MCSNRTNLRHSRSACFLLLVAGFAVQAEALDKIYWADQIAGIRRANLDGTNLEFLVFTPASSLAIDETAGVMFYAANPLIYRNNLDGTSEVMIHDLTPMGETRTQHIGVDPFSEKLYWSAFDTGKIQRSNYDGTNIEDIVTGLTTPVGLNVDYVRGKIYWNDRPGAARIVRVNLDGLNPEVIYTSVTADRPVCMAIDLQGLKLYWTERVNNEVKRANLDGSNVELLYTLPPTSFVQGIAVDGQPASKSLRASKLYVADLGAIAIFVSNLDGSNQSALITGVFPIAPVIVGGGAFVPVSDPFLMSLLAIALILIGMILLKRGVKRA